MSSGKRITCYGLTDLDTTSEDTLLQDIAHRLKVNIRVCRWLAERQCLDESLLTLAYPKTVSIHIETDDETGLVYSYSFADGEMMGFQYVDFYPGGFFSVDQTYPGDWRIMAEDIQNNFKSYNNRNEYIEERNRVHRFCATLGCREILMMSDHDYDVIEDLKMERSSMYKTKSVQQLLAQLQEYDGVTCYHYAELLTSDKGFYAGGMSSRLTVFYDDFRAI